jgi:hypothetical protein
MKSFKEYKMDKIKRAARRIGAFVNPPPMAGHPGSPPRVRDYPIAAQPPPPR